MQWFAGKRMKLMVMGCVWVLMSGTVSTQAQDDAGEPVLETDFTLTLEISGKGQVLVDPDLTAYPAGTEVILSAVPDDDRYALVGWEGDASGQQDRVTITMDEDKFVAGEFGKVIVVGPHLYAFGAPTKSLANPAGEEYSFITGDGLSLYYPLMRLDLLPKEIDSIFRVTRTAIGAPWSEPEDLMIGNVNTDLNVETTMELSLTDDELALYYLQLEYADNSDSHTDSRWLVVRRASTDEEFDFSQAEQLGPEWDAEAGPGPGSITRDGTGFIYTSERAGGSSEGAIWYAALDPNSNELGEASLVAAVPGSRLTSPEMSADGLTAMFRHTGGPHTIYMAARASLDAPWSEAVSLPAPIATGREHDVTMSSDLTRIYFSSHRPGTTPIDPRHPWGAPPGGPGFDIFEARMRRLPGMAHWALDESGRSSQAENSFGSNDGLLRGHPQWQPQNGMIDGALLLDGVDDTILLPSIVNPAGPLSILVWIKGGQSGQVILSQEGGRNWLKVDAEGKLMTEMNDSDPLTAALVSNTVITDDQWHHIGLVWDETYRTLYVDGTPVAMDIQEALPRSAQPLIVGSDPTGQPGTFWSGMVDDIWIYNMVVSP